MRVPIVCKTMIFSLLVASPVLSDNLRQRVQKRNRPPKIQSFTASKTVIDLCPFFPDGSCSSSGKIVTLEVKAGDPDLDNLTYKYSVSAGTIVGSGATVNWDLSDSRLGIQTASVEVNDRRGGHVSARTTVDLVVCGACDPPCPTLTVTCPTEVNQGADVVFVATVSGQQLTYLWSHSNGKRIAGQEGSELRIKAVGLPGDVITATVRVLGIDPACNYQASCESRIVKAYSRSEK
jgi:hypothetical protein